MKGKISDINDLVTQPLKMFGALLYGPNEYRVNKNFDEIYKQLNQSNDEMLEAQQLNSNIILNQNEVFFNDQYPRCARAQIVRSFIDWIFTSVSNHLLR